jgi:hypothetical protein
MAFVRIESIDEDAASSNGTLPATAPERASRGFFCPLANLPVSANLGSWSCRHQLVCRLRRICRQPQPAPTFDHLFQQVTANVCEQSVKSIEASDVRPPFTDLFDLATTQKHLSIIDVISDPSHSKSFCLSGA